MKKVDFDQTMREKFLLDIVSDGMAKQGLKVMTYAYKEMPRSQYEEIKLVPDVREELEKG